jgi:hypothetical protein
MTIGTEDGQPSGSSIVSEGCADAGGSAPAAPTTSAEVRDDIVRKLHRDLIGPAPVLADEDIARERLGDPPSSWYLAGFLVPDPDHAEPLQSERPFAELDRQQEEDRRRAEQARQAEMEEIQDFEGEVGADRAGAADDDGSAGEEEAKAVRRLFPSSLGLTVLLPPEVEEIEAVVTWGDYLPEPPPTEGDLFGEDAGEPAESQPESGGRPARERDLDWIRRPRRKTVRVPIDKARKRTVEVPDSSAVAVSGGSLRLSVHVREFPRHTIDGPDGRIHAVTVFLLNQRPQVPRKRYRDATYAFQARLDLHCPTGFAPRYDLSDYRSDDADLRVADLHYRDVAEYAVGRNVGADWAAPDAEDRVTHVWTDPLPRAEVHRVAPNTEIASAEFGMAALAEAARSGGDALAARLTGLAEDYASWIADQGERAEGLRGERRRAIARHLVEEMEAARARIADGVELLRTDPRARRAFELTNVAIEQSARRRIAWERGLAPEEVGPPTWRPFQLAYILLNLRAMVDPSHGDREIVDLLYFPTGGGKTEAYLGLAAFAICLRRLARCGVLGAGVTVIMRYTLRLLTLDQLARTAGVICALELQRTDPANRDETGHPELGDWPIEIGLWVGDAASPNRLGQKNDTGTGAERSARKRVRDYARKRTDELPAPMEACPWCGTPFDRESFKCVPDHDHPTNVEIRCSSPSCAFTGDRALPVVTVDEAIYRRLPAFLIATVDKFAGLPWVGQAGGFFGNVTRFEEDVGFFGPADPANLGARLPSPGRLDPPQLIVQDELHLISGPLGTVAGLYETAIDRLASRQGEDGRWIRPKIVASTATVRRAQSQIRSLFDRDRTAVFPPPGVERTDSFFARTVSSDDEPPRWYIGLAAQGRGPKLIFLRTLTRLMSAAQAAYDSAAGSGDANPADPYMTGVCYFNALRELGGARRIVEDEVRTDVRAFGRRRRRLDPDDPVFGNREIGQPLELTSRVSTNEVSQAKRRLAARFDRDADPVDVALATNMISVGLDITRLGLMLVQGQPKTAAEYIQSTSRVGRDPNRPGLVATILNLHKPRDRVHYEQFGQFHRTFYRAVEPTSVTPWAARAVDRALAAVVVAIARHLDPEMTPERAVTELKDKPEVRRDVRETILARARDHGVAGGLEALEDTVDRLLDDWQALAHRMTENAGNFAYTHEGGKHHLLYPPLHPDVDGLDDDHRQFVAARSMRDVEPNAPLDVCDPWGRELKGSSGRSTRR